RRAYEDMCDAIVGGIRRGCDAAFLALHGAMVAEHVDDGEGELLRRIRAVAPRLPIAVGLDFHTQLTSTMVANATVITGYRTDHAGPGLARADAGSRVAAARGLPLQGRAARLADCARADTDGGARHPRRPRRQHRVRRHAGRDERGGGGDAPASPGRSCRADL